MCAYDRKVHKRGARRNNSPGYGKSIQRKKKRKTTGNFQE